MAAAGNTASGPLGGNVAVVAGATRGAGRGIARALGEAGAIVYCTGRSVAGTGSPYGRPETVDGTVDLIAAAGGTAIAVRVDHTVEDDVKALFDRVRREHGRLDVVADSVAGEDPLLGGWTSLDGTDLSNAGRALQGSLLSHVITAKHAAAVMRRNPSSSRRPAARRGSGLIVEVTEFDLFFGGGGNIIAALVKTGLKNLAVLLAEELRSHHIAVVSLTPGYLRSEAMLDGYGVTEDNWRDGARKDPNFAMSESPMLVGRAVAALAADPHVMRRTAQILSSWDLAREYGFTDANGERPDWGAHFTRTVIPSTKWLREGIERQIAWLDGLTARARGYVGQP